MQPTGRLRFVERAIMVVAGEYKTVHILQQEFREEIPAQDAIYGRSVLVWRDVPVEVET